MVADLAAGHRVERRAVEDDLALLAGLEPGGERAVRRTARTRASSTASDVVAEELGSCARSSELHVDGVALDRAHLARLAGALLLGGELALEARAVDA